jgi:hypothetical protein
MESTMVEIKEGGKVWSIEVPKGKILVTMPDMFVSFMSVAPTINPCYEKARVESEQWINR